MTELNVPPPPTGDEPGVASDRSLWNWLLFLPIVVPLLTPLFNRTLPGALGIPAFYWHADRLHRRSA